MQRKILFVVTPLASEFASHVDSGVVGGQLQSDNDFCVENSLPVVNLFLCSEVGWERGGSWVSA